MTGAHFHLAFNHVPVVLVPVAVVMLSYALARLKWRPGDTTPWTMIATPRGRPGRRHAPGVDRVPRRSNQPSRATGGPSDGHAERYSCAASTPAALPTFPHQD